MVKPFKRLTSMTRMLLLVSVASAILIIVTFGIDIATLVKVSPSSTSSPLGDQEVFEFAAIGDTAYLEPQWPDFLNLMQGLNTQKIDFTIHVGDIRGSFNCTDASFQRVKDVFEASEVPLIYEIGDNEWMDCWLVLDHTGQNFPSPVLESNPELADPIKALNRIRKMFYPDSMSLGKKKIKLIRQSDHGDMSSTPFNETEYREHQLWIHKRVVFSTLHVEGSGNGIEKTAFGYTMPEAYHNKTLAEMVLREQAVTAWMDKTFDVAKASNALGIVLSLQANPRFYVRVSDRPTQAPGYITFHNDLIRNVKAYDKPILLIHGDSHFFSVDKPYTRFSVFPPVLYNGTEVWPPKYAEDFTRVEVPGADHSGWVRIRVNPNNPDLFEPLYGRIPLSQKVSGGYHVYVGYDQYH